MLPSIVTKPVPELERRIVVEDLKLDMNYFDKNINFIVPKNFIYDGASIPRALWSFVGTPYSCKYDTPGCIHDYLYSKSSDDIINSNNVKTTLDRYTADYIFRDLLCKNGVNTMLAYIMYFIVRCFGGLYYKQQYGMLTNDD